MGRWTSILAILSLVVIPAVPQRRWGRFTWVPWALVFAALAIKVDHELIARRLFWFALFTVWAALSAILSIGLAVEATRGSKGGSDPGEGAARS